MSKSFAQLRKSRGRNLDHLTKEVEKLKSNNNQADDRFWKLERDKSGNGSALIRFLPAPKDENLPWVRYWDHGFQGPGGWYIEKSLTTLGKTDPVSEYNKALWNSGIEANKDKVRKQKRRLHYVSNILVLKDPKNPDNEGKVFLFRYGKKIFDMLNEVMSPTEDELGDSSDPIDPFDLWEGANFKLRVRQVQGFPNYDKSEFESVSSLFENEEDERYEKIWAEEHSLQDLISEDKFKSYEDLKTRLDRVLGVGLPDVPDTSETASVDSSVSESAEEVEIGDSDDSDEVEESSDDEVEEEGIEFLQNLEKLAADS